MILLLILAGCAANVAHPLSSEDLAALKHSDESVVLMRFTVEDQKGNRLDPFVLLGWRSPSQAMRLSIGDFDSGGKPKSYDFRILSADALKEGWLTLTLPPGYFYFVIETDIFASVSTPAFGSGSARARLIEAAPRWRIAVPPGAAVVYAGSFQLHVTKGLKFIELTLGTLDQGATKIGDETAMAIETAHRDLPSLPPPVTRLAVLHTGPILLDMPPPAQ